MHNLQAADGGILRQDLKKVSLNEESALGFALGAFFMPAVSNWLKKQNFVFTFLGKKTVWYIEKYENWINYINAYLVFSMSRVLRKSN